MEKNKINRFVYISLLSCCFFLTACNRENTVPNEPTVSESQSSQTAEGSTEKPSTTEEATTPSTTPDDVSTEGTKSLTISVINMCGIEVGMVAVIDPATGEQVNLDSLSTGESISMEANWPSDVNEFQWALYNTNGELCIEGKTDISQASTSATLVLTGQNYVSNPFIIA